MNANLLVHMAWAYERQITRLKYVLYPPADQLNWSRDDAVFFCDETGSHFAMLQLENRTEWGPGIDPALRPLFIEQHKRITECLSRQRQWELHTIEAVSKEQLISIVDRLPLTYLQMRVRIWADYFKL